jgi:amino acid exporter
LAWRMLKGDASFRLRDVSGLSIPRPSSLFVRGLVTDLANPQTVLFFASIFAITLTATTPAWAKIVSWLGIVVVSAIWRVFLSFAFSRNRMRSVYSRWQRTIERLTGTALAAFGVKLIVEGFSRR